MVLKENQWSSLEAGVIEKILHFVKQSLRWKCEAPVLRLLNKHWCLEVNRHVFCIRPHHSRSINATDLRSLVKFSRITSLDATRFTKEFEARNFPSLSILSRLCNLSSLKIATENRNGIGAAALLSLNRLTALTLDTAAQTYVPEKDLRLLSRLPLQEITIRWPLQRMGPYLQRCHTLTHLSAQVLPAEFDFSFDLALLNGLTSLKLSFRSLNNNFNLPDLSVLSSVTTLKDVDLTELYSNDLDWLVHSPSLSSLKIFVASTDALSSAAFLHLLQRLTVFHVKCNASQSTNLGQIIQRATRLKELSLSGFAIDCREIMETMRSLNTLSVQKCKLRHNRRFLADLTGLKKLGFQGNEDPFSHLRLGSSNLLSLSVLKLNLREVHSITIIGRLTNLVILGLRTPDPLSVHALTQLGTLPQLTEFGISPPFPESAVNAFIKSEVLSYLEVLYLSDEYDTFNASSLQLLREKLPHLKIETNVATFASFMEKL